MALHRYVTAAAHVHASVISSDSDDGVFTNDSQSDENSCECKIGGEAKWKDCVSGFLSAIKARVSTK